MVTERAKELVADEIGRLIWAKGRVDEAMSTLAAVQTELDRVRHALDDRSAYMQELQVLLEGDQDPAPPKPPEPPAPVWKTLISGPGKGPVAGSRAEFHQLFTPGSTMKAPWRDWHSKAGSENNAAEYRDSGQGGLFVKMNPANLQFPRAGSSESHEGWVYFDKRYLGARMELELMMVPPFSWPLTGKVGGIVGWNGDWSQWPGGGNSGPENASVRLIWNDWGHQGRPRLGAYVYLGGVFNQTEVTGHAANYVSNAGHSVEYLLHDYGSPRAGAWLPVSIETSADPVSGRGGLLVSVEGREVLRVANLPWFTPGTKDKGWNTGYLCGLFGGDAPEYNPQGGSRTYGYRNVVWSGQ